KCGSATASIFGKRSTELCLVCCDSDLCNSDCGNRTRPITKTTTTTILTTTMKYSFPFDCWEILHNGYNITGVYQIYPWGSSGKSIDVLCNMDIDPKDGR
ncbi:tenascin-N-like, partial [Saccostrea cucullata]|uniref:tenascin-N-like n=1 Tax=Saccostrea cuccullata TaxID=36930 RepID=UPI002ED0B9C2